MFGKERFLEIFNKYRERPILLYGDPDVDGLISLLLMCRWAESQGLKYSYYVNQKRQHGFFIDAQKLKGYLVIAADFEITREEMQVLVDNDVAVLSTDHHDCEKEFIDCKGVAEGIVINNQYPFEPDEDRYLSGAGVFYELMCDLYPDFQSVENKALVGVTLLSDVRQIENKKARDYLKTTYSVDSSKGFINYLVESVLETDYTFGLPKLDRNFIDFNLSPYINALLRLDKVDDATSFILGKGASTSYSSPKTVQKEILENMKAKASYLNLGHLIIVAVNSLDFAGQGFDPSVFIGLLCSNVKDSNGNKSTIGFTYENGQVQRASFRGRCDDIHYKFSFKQIGIRAEGHANAFGILDFKPTSDLWVQLDDLIADLEITHKQTATVVESRNLAITLTQKGMEYATENCYVRDMYRYYIKYVGTNAKIVKTTYKKEEFSAKDYASGLKADEEYRGVKYKYFRDENGNPIPKYIEYLVDGRKVKSFGVLIEDGLILPMLEKGYIQLYVRSSLN